MKYRSLLALLASLFCLSAVSATHIHGAGATFPYPLYTKWFSDFRKTDPEVEINYQSIGSGGGVQQFLKGTVDFGATDAPMSDEQLKAAGKPVLHIPTVLGAVVVTYNVPGVEKGLQLDGPLVADIFLGVVTKWDDARIKALNPKAKLSGNILVVRRSDGSGTTNVFTEYLSKVSEAWKTKVGTGTAVNWPVGLGGKGNEGVTGLLKQTPGAIGYVELLYAEKNELPYASIKNQGGTFTLPTTKAVTAAAAAGVATIPADFRTSLTNATGKDSYPLAAYTYLVLWKDGVHGKDGAVDKEKTAKLQRFLKWALADGQKLAEGLNYAPLPAPLVTRVAKAVGEMSPSTKKTP